MDITRVNDDGSEDIFTVSDEDMVAMLTYTKTIFATIKNFYPEEYSNIMQSAKDVAKEDSDFQRIMNLYNKIFG